MMHHSKYIEKEIHKNLVKAIILTRILQCEPNIQVNPVQNSKPDKNHQQVLV